MQKRSSRYLSVVVNSRSLGDIGGNDLRVIGYVMVMLLVSCRIVGMLEVGKVENEASSTVELRGRNEIE